MKERSKAEFESAESVARRTELTNGLIRRIAEATALHNGPRSARGKAARAHLARLDKVSR